MRLHVMLQPDSADALCRQGLLAEELGFDAVWIANMLSTRDPFMALSVLARESKRIRVGPVAISPFETHPLKMASALLTLNEFARGRAALVVGGGGGTTIGMGLKPARTSTMPRMVRAVRECVAILRQAAGGGPVNHDGEVYRISGYAPAWARGPAPRIDVAANGPQMLRLAGEVADGVMLSDIDLHFLQRTLDGIREGAARAGRAPPPANNVLAFHVKSDRDAAYAEARRNLWVRGIWERSRIEPWLEPAECEQVVKNLAAWQQAYAEGRDPATVVPRAIVDRLVDRMTLTGTPADLPRLAARLQEYADGGVAETSLRLYGEPEDAMRLVAARVAPALAGTGNT